MNQRSAGLTVAEIAAIKAAGRRRLAAVPFPLAAFGLVNLGGVLATALVGRYHLALYGIPAFALAVWLSARVVRRRAQTDGVQVAIRPVALTVVALCVAGASASHGGDLLGIDALTAVGPFLAQATGFWLLGRWADSDALMAASILMLLGSVVIGGLTSGDLAVGLQFGLYGALLLTAARSVARPSPT